MPFASNHWGSMGPVFGGRFHEGTHAADARCPRNSVCPYVVSGRLHEETDTAETRAHSWVHTNILLIHRLIYRSIHKRCFGGSPLRTYMSWPWLPHMLPSPMPKARSAPSYRNGWYGRLLKGCVLHHHTATGVPSRVARAKTHNQKRMSIKHIC